MTPSHTRMALLLRALLLAGFIGAAVHIDWHLARPGPHRLSFDLSYHWLSAVPVFALMAWYAARTWPRRPVVAALALIGAGALLGQAVVPAGEMLMSGQSWSEVMRPIRVESFREFIAAGLLTSTVVLLWVRRASSART
ncbi:MAG: hypothetical protein HKM89_05540 [Gemmatimonadales bacterium]|nr:hypothetical protein [Gemmatimonadales bacterium]